MQKGCMSLHSTTILMAIYCSGYIAQTSMASWLYSPDQYAMDLVGALNASGVPLIVELPQGDEAEPMFSSNPLPEVDNGRNIIHS